MLTKRQENESFTDYHIRLFENSENYDINSDDIAILLNKEYGSDYSESKWRKDYAQYVRWKEYILKNENPMQEELDKLTVKKFEVQKERNKLQAEKLEINRWIREQARAENIQEKVVNAIANLEPIKPPVFRKNSIITEEKTIMVDLADSHYGRQGVIYGLKNEILAEYSIEIYERRMWELLDKVVEIVKKECPENVIIVNLGDQLDGLLRLTQLQFLQLGVVESTMRSAEFLSKWLVTLSERVEGIPIEYYSILGNHAENRLGSIKSGELKQENMEFLIPWFIKERLKDCKSITVYDASFIQLLSVYETNILAVHGQDEKNLENALKDYSMIYQEQIHILKTGHLHHLSNRVISMDGLQNVEFLQSPSICGIDEYSLKLKKIANAGSLVTVFRKGYGKEITYDVRLK